MNSFAKISPFHSAPLSLMAAVVLGISVHAQEPPGAAHETLQGEEAVQHLKEQGQYESLVEAVNAAREADTEANGGNTPDAIGQSAKLVAPDGVTSNELGESVAVSGDTIIIGAGKAASAPGNFSGAAYVFIRSGTAWVLQQKLFASDAAGTDYFGGDVAIEGDTAVIGARFEDLVGFDDNRGAAYVFVRSGSTWTEQAKLLASDGTSGDEFGGSVAISGNTVVVGADKDGAGAGSPALGSAYVFVRTGTAWSQQQKLTVASAVNDRFGVSVGISGETIVVGALNNDVGGIMDRGTAYVFVRSGTVWSLQQQLVAADGVASAFFGESVAISGETIIIGAYGNSAAYVFVRGGTNWTQQQKLLVPGGRAVALSGNTALIGAFGDGASYVFNRTGTVWTQAPRLFPADGQQGDRFGVSVGISGDTAIVGASFHKIGLNNAQGTAYVFKVLTPAWLQEANGVASDGTAFAHLGWSVALSGDTAIVGAITDDPGGVTNQGSAYIFVRSGATWTQQQKLLASDGAANDQFGNSVAISGQTAVVGAELADVGAATDRGAAYVFVRNGTVWTQQQKLLATDGAATDQFGRSVAISGGTIVVGAPLDDLGSNLNAGSAYVFLRSGTSTWTQQQQLTASGGLGSDLFGESVAISQNTIIVGAHLDDVGSAANQGSAYIFTRSGTTWTQQQQLFGSDSAAGDRFGSRVSISQETAVVGATLADVSMRVDQGAAYVFVRNGTTWSQQAKLVSPDGAAGDIFGSDVAIDSDIIVIGAQFDDVGANANQGSAHVFERAGTTWTHRRQLTSAPAAHSDRFGNSVSVSGDKIIVGAPFADMPAGDQGAAFFFVNVPPFAATAAVSRKAHGAAETFDIPLPLAGTPAVECRSSGGAHTLVFTFTQDVVSGNASLTEGVGSVSGTPTFSGNTMTVNLSGISDVQRITVTVSGVADTFGQVLPPTAVSLNMLIGDTNGDRTVNAGDALQTRSRSGQGTDVTNFRNDVNSDGVVNSGDSLAVRNRSGASLP
jgi:hypothetical protein